MDLWRISNYRDLSGGGGLHVEGRWHSKGRPIVYLADQPTGALLEVLVHLDQRDAPSNYQLHCVRVSDAAAIEVVEVSVLPMDWRDDQDFTRRIGDKWLEGCAAVLLRVPSALSPRASNYLLNPAHAAASDIRIVETLVAPFDSRFWKK
jgi:RES domain-containing protein